MLRLNKVFKIILCAICLGITSGYAQITESSLANYQNKYPSSNKISLKSERIVNIEVVDGEIEITQTEITEDFYLNESASQYSEESVSYSSFFELNEIEASTFNLENGKMVENKVETFRKKDELDNAFHDDIQSLNFIYPNLGKGSKTRLYTEETIHNPRFLSAFFFGDFYPLLHGKLTLIVDNDIHMDFKQFNMEEIPIVYSEKKKRKKTIYTWEITDREAIKMESATPNYKNYFPHIVPTILNYEGKIGTVKFASSPEDLYGWYHSLTKDINKEPTNTELENLVHDLTKDKTSEIEKVRAIYYWVQNNIKYIAFEYALGGFVPREANDVYSKRFGDCKDNSSILYEMLKVAGIKGNLTWIGTRSIPYSYEELPTPAVDNHMILAYQNEDDIYFLDATGRYIPLEFPTSFIQGKEALVGNGDAFEIVTVPVVEPERNKIKVATQVSISENLLTGKGTNSISGYKKIDLFHRLEGINSDKKLKEYYLSFLKLGNNKFNLLNFQEYQKFDYDKDFEIMYEFEIADYLLKSEDELYVNLNLDKKLEEFQIEKNRKTDIETDYKEFFEFDNELVIPEGYTVDYLPENLNIESELLDISITYKQLENKIIYNHQLKFKFLVLTTDHFESYKSIFKKVNKAYKELIVFKEK